MDQIAEENKERAVWAVKEAKAGKGVTVGLTIPLPVRTRHPRGWMHQSILLSAAYLSLREAEKRMSTSTVAVEEATLNFKIAKERYSAGLDTNLDVVDAELALAQTKTNYVQALYDYNTSKTQLDKGMGLISLDTKVLYYKI